MLKTPLNEWHHQHGGRMVDFAGWEMPVMYESINEEHTAVREQVGLFDISHMGRLKFTGADAERFLDHLLTNDVTKLKVGQIRYSLVCNPQGGILDDVLVYRLPSHYLLVVNASNREKIIAWIENHRQGFHVTVEDQTASQAMIAIQGPKALELLGPLVSVDLTKFKYYTGQEAVIDGTPGLVTRTGYTGEDGFEVILPPDKAAALWEKLLQNGQPLGVRAVGLGARDTLRLEAAMPLYGHELNEQIDPLTAGLQFGVKLNAEEFIGRKALQGIALKENLPQRVGLELEGKRIAREGAKVLAGGQEIGEVTSGTFSPTLQKSIAMAYVPREHSELGTALQVDIRGKQHPAKVVPLPFYKR